MRYLIISLLPLLMLPLLLPLASCSSDDTAEHAATAEIWTCPMHPSVQSDRPGACPVCHMDLVKKADVEELGAEDEAMLRAVTLSPSQRMLANVETAPVRRRPMTQTFRAPGVVDFAEPLQAAVSARFRGRIEKLHAAVTGAQVRRGQPLFDLYSPELISAQQDYIVALDALDQASSPGSTGMDAQKRLVEAIRERLTLHYGLSPQPVQDIARTRKAQSVVSVTAPIGGTVIRKSAQEGRYVDEGSVVYELADLSRVWVYLEVPERQIHLVRVGQAVDLTSEAWPGDGFRGTVSFIDPVMQGQTRTTRVRVEVANTARKLKPQMYVTGGIAVSRSDQLAVPVTAVLRTGKRDVVWIETAENVFEPREVTLGAKVDGMIEIVSGLQEGELVAISGGYLLDSESTLLHPRQASMSVHPPSHSQEGSNPQEAPSPQGGNRQPGKAEQEVRILVKAGYHPDTVRVAAGRSIRLIFERREKSSCSEEIVFPDFKIRKMLPAFRSTEIEIPAQKPGTYRFHCGMDMLEGYLVVK
jgi:Cu(I)/Ag(I) efflux system membrane fusion protein